MLTTFSLKMLLGFSPEMDFMHIFICTNLSLRMFTNVLILISPFSSHRFSLLLATMRRSCILSPFHVIRHFDFFSKSKLP